MFKAISTLSLASIFATLLNFATIIALYWMYDLNLVGENAVFVSIGAISSVVATLRLELSIFSNREQDESTYVATIAITLVIVPLAIYTLLSFFNISTFLLYIYLLGISAQNAFIKYLNFHEEYGVIASSHIITATAKIALVYFFSNTNLDINPISLSYTISIFMSLAFLQYYVLRKIANFRGFSVRKVPNFVVQNSDFYTFGMLGAVLNKSYTEGIIIATNILFGPEQTAILNAARKVIGLPITVISNNLLMISHKQFSINSSISQNLLITIIATTILTVAAIYYLPTTLYVEVFQIIGGEIKVVTIALLAALFGRMIAVPLASYFQVMRKQKILFNFQLVHFVLYFMAFYTVSQFQDFIVTLITTSLIALANYLLLSIYVLKKLQVYGERKKG